MYDTLFMAGSGTVGCSCPSSDPWAVSAPLFCSSVCSARCWLSLSESALHRRSRRMSACRNIKPTQHRSAASDCTTPPPAHGDYCAASKHTHGQTVDRHWHIERCRVLMGYYVCVHWLLGVAAPLNQRLVRLHHRLQSHLSSFYWWETFADGRNSQYLIYLMIYYCTRRKYCMFELEMVLKGAVRTLYIIWA